MQTAQGNDGAKPVAFITGASYGIGAACALALSVLVIPGDPDRWPLFVLACVAVILIFWRHRANIQRLRNGTEHRWEKKKKSGGQP